jgi:hypothetical protein
MNKSAFDDNKSSNSLISGFNTVNWKENDGKSITDTLSNFEHENFDSRSVLSKYSKYSKAKSGGQSSKYKK